jgi:prolyl-tRNA editing enzyme YbaK/EbsC (Cys-tRNA(Pro) deacylase)
MLGPLDVHQYLVEHNVAHEIVRLPRPAVGAEHLAEVLGLSPRRCLAVHPFHAWTASADVLVLLLASADLATHTLPALQQLIADRLGDDATLEVAGAELVSRHTDYLAGHVTPLMLPDDVIVVATPEVADLAMSIIYTATGDGGTALGISAADLIELSHAHVLAAPEPASISLDRDGARAARPFPVSGNRASTGAARPAVIATAS